MNIKPSVHYSHAGGPVGREALEGLPQEPAFSTREYERRLSLVRAEMKDDGVDVLLVFRQQYRPIGSKYVEIIMLSQVRIGQLTPYLTTAS